jgi:hypothetical protein
MKPLACLLLLGWLVIPVHAALYSPRVVSPHHADTYSLKTFAEFDRWRNLSGDAKVYEVFKYLADRRTGLYPMGTPAREGREELPEYGAVTDPVKMLNVYPIGHCGTLGPTAAGIWEGMGLGPARTLVLPGWNHVAAEVFAAGRWHYFDLDVRAVFRRADGTLASMEEARTEASLWRQPNSPLFFPLDSLESVRRTYASTRVEHRYGVASGGHTMDFVLRQGETFTRWWTPQGGRWNHHPSYAVKPFPRSVLEREPRGPKSKHASFTVHTHGNGRFVYRPDLTSRSSDFEDGMYDAQNAQPGPSGLTLKAAGDAYAVFEVRTPYVIAPWVGDLDTAADDREASTVKVEGTGVRLALSLDHGRSWQRLSLTNGAVDLTPQVAGRYGYLLRLDLRGQPDQAVVRAMEIVTWVQVHPASLPSLRQGKNTMRLVTGDHYGLPTRVMAVCPSAADREEFLKPLVEPPQDYDPARRTSRVRGSFVAQMKAPPGTKIAWFSAGGSFAANLGAGRQTRNAIAYGLSASGPFQHLYRAEVPPDQSHWHYNVDREVRLDDPAREVFVRYTGDPAVNNIRLFAHCVDDRPRAPAPVLVTHAWTENGVRRSRQVRLDGPGEYEVEAKAEPVDEFIEIVIPSVARAAVPSRPGGREGRGGSLPKKESAPWFAELGRDAFPRVPVFPREVRDRVESVLRACLKNVRLRRARPRPSSFVLGFAGNFEDEDEGRGRGRDANRIFRHALTRPGGRDAFHHVPVFGLTLGDAVECAPAIEGGGQGTKPPPAIQPPTQSWFPQAPPLPAPSGEVIRVATVEELFSAVARVKAGGTVFLADGHYWLPRCLRLRTDRLTLRGESGERTRVILDGAKSQEGELLALHACSGVTIADLTVQNVRHNGIKLNSDSNVQRVTLYNLVLHNIWQRAVKGVKVPLEQRETLSPQACRIQYGLFYNDRPKRYTDDPADTPQNFGGNYVGGIDVMCARGWVISDNVFVGIQGRTRGARGAVFLWHEAVDCVIERNLILDCDTGIALGNSHKPAEVPVHATRCVVRNNFITRAPENGIVADYTRDCQIVHNTIHDPTNRLGRLIRLVHDNDGLLVANNLLSGPPLRNESTSRMTLRHNPALDLADYFVDPAAGNLRLKAQLPAGVDSAEVVAGVADDIDRQPRRGRPVPGADDPG